MTGLQLSQTYTGFLTHLDPSSLRLPLPPARAYDSLKAQSAARLGNILARQLLDLGVVRLPSSNCSRRLDEIDSTTIRIGRSALPCTMSVGRPTSWWSASRSAGTSPSSPSRSNASASASSLASSTASSRRRRSSRSERSCACLVRPPRRRCSSVSRWATLQGPGHAGNARAIRGRGTDANRPRRPGARRVRA
jgi:hypothetical protein